MFFAMIWQFHNSLSLILSQVLKVDGAYVAVKFPGTSSSMSNQSTAAPADSDPSSLLQDCRLLRIDELQVWTWIIPVLLVFILRFRINVFMQQRASFLLKLPSLNVFLQVVKSGGTPKVPDCFQRTPKKLCIPEKAEILAVNVDSKGWSFSLYVSAYKFTFSVSIVLTCIYTLL